MIHTTVGVYLSGNHKANGVLDEHLEAHIEYNKTKRWGRALLVNGKVVHLGYYQESDRAILEEKFGHIKIEVDTQPYV